MRSRRIERYDDVELQVGQLRGQGLQLFVGFDRTPPFHNKVLALDVAELAQAFVQSLFIGIVCADNPQYTDSRNCALFSVSGHEQQRCSYQDDYLWEAEHLHPNPELRESRKVGYCD